LEFPVLQAYGLTETTGICTLDDPRVPVEPGCVGTVITGIEMKLAENEEIVVAVRHIFAGLLEPPGRNCPRVARWMVPTPATKAK